MSDPLYHPNLLATPNAPPGHDPFGLPAQPPAPNHPDVGSMRFGERRWGDTLDVQVDVPGESDSPIVVAAKQYLSVNDVARVWALRLSCTWVNFAANFAENPTDDATAGFTVVAGVGSGMIPHTYLFKLLALDGFAELFLPAFPAQAIQVLGGLVFAPASAGSRTESFQFAASVAPYTRLRHDE